MAEFDELADTYDETRGGERRGDEYAADIDALLPAGDGPILEIGVGTGVVALGLARRGRRVVGLDISAPMLERARPRLGATIVRADAMAMAIATASVAHAVSVWVVQSVSDPIRLFAEAARVLQPDGRYVVCASQEPAPDDRIGQIIAAMGVEVDRRRGAVRPRTVTVDDVLGWAAPAGFAGAVHRFERRWYSTVAEELYAVEQRVWPALRELDETAIEEVTRGAVEALRSLPDVEYVRRSIANVVVLRRG